jgi:hypothetical protein
VSVVHRLRRPAGNETGRCGFVFAEGAGASSVCVRTEDFKPRSGKNSRQGASDISPGRGPQGRDLVLGVENEIRAEGEDAILGKGANQIESPVGATENLQRSRAPIAKTFRSGFSRRHFSSCRMSSIHSSTLVLARARPQHQVLDRFARVLAYGFSHGRSVSCGRSILEPIFDSSMGENKQSPILQPPDNQGRQDGNTPPSR